MSRLTANPKLFVALLTLALFFLLNSLPRSRTEMGGQCVSGLDQPEETRSRLVTTVHGMPLPNLMVMSDSCFGLRGISISCLPGVMVLPDVRLFDLLANCSGVAGLIVCFVPLALNLFAFALFGWVLYGLVVRFRSLWFHA